MRALLVALAVTYVAVVGWFWTYNPSLSSPSILDAPTPPPPLQRWADSVVHFFNPNSSVPGSTVEVEDSAGHPHMLSTSPGFLLPEVTG